MEGKMTIMFWISFLLFAVLFSCIIAFYVDAMRTSSTQNDKLVGYVYATVLPVAFATLGLTLYAFGGNPARMIQFLYIFTLLIILPTCTITAAVSAQHLYGLREAVANKKA